MDEILMKRAHLDEIFAHAGEAAPNEACGLLAGRGAEVKRVYRAGNADASPVSYRFDPAEQMRAMKEMKGEGLELVAIYHSHPHSPPYPSQVDTERAFFPGTREPNFPGAAYVIVSLAPGGPEARAYHITPGGIEEVSIRVL